MQSKASLMYRYTTLNKVNWMTENINNHHENGENLTNYKFILGEMGIQILIAISRGANTKISIRLLSGVPGECINGRLPVLSNLELIYQRGILPQEEYYLTDRGNDLLMLLEKE